MLQTVSADRWRSLEAGAERGGAAVSGGAGGDRGRPRGHPGGGEVPGDRRRLGTLSNRSVMLRTSGRRAGSISFPTTITTTVSLRSSEVICGPPEPVLSSCARWDAVLGSVHAAQAPETTSFHTRGGATGPN